jgi:CheY-like chemotaxis protein
MAATATEGHVQHRRKVVLVVDDSVELLDAVRALLEPNFDVLQASDPFVGVRLAATCEPDAIVMDLEMPGMDGVEATRFLKRLEQTRDIPVIAFTGHEPKSAARRRGFERIVTKSGSLEELETQIEDVLSAA